MQYLSILFWGQTMSGRLLLKKENKTSNIKTKNILSNSDLEQDNKTKFVNDEFDNKEKRGQTGS